MLEQIQKLLTQTYFLKSDEIVALLPRLRLLPEEGLKKVLAVLEDAKIKQNSFLVGWIERDKTFLSGFGAFLEGNEKVIRASAKFTPPAGIA